MSDDPKKPKTLAEKLREKQEQAQREEVSRYEAEQEAFRTEERRKEQTRQQTISTLIEMSLAGVEKALEAGASRNPLYRFAVAATIPTEESDPRLKRLADAITSLGFSVLYIFGDVVLDGDFNQVGQVATRKPINEGGQQVGWQLELRVRQAHLTGWYGKVMNDTGYALVVGQW